MAYADYRIGDIVTMKKPHPCGNRDWEVLRIGADFRIRCRGCGHTVLIPRPKFMKAARALVCRPESSDAVANGSPNTDVTSPDLPPRTEL